MQQSQFGQQGQRPSSQATVLALRGLNQIYEINMTAARVVLQTQARAASVFGWPDWTTVFNRVDDKTRSVFAQGADQLMQTAQRANDAANELQRQVGRVVETQAATVAESVQQGLQEISTQATEGLQQICEIARQQADAAERVAQSLSQEMHDTVRESSAQMRQALRRGGDETRDTLRQASDQTNEAVRQAGDQAREGARAAGEEAQKGIHRMSEGPTAQGQGNGEAQKQDTPNLIVSESGTTPSITEDRGRRQRGANA
ncbi:MAG TPA: hypothetical protein VFP68_11310 [Burkholderiaceae bacterium]|nr:hypothetical protein [Burkholderiaceae bacterium]